MTDGVEYPAGTVRALLDSPHVSPATHAALERRMNISNDSPPRFFTNETCAVLVAVCHRLVPEALLAGINVAAVIDARLAAGAGNGWRYDSMPSDGTAYELGLRGLDEHAVKTFTTKFAELDNSRQDMLLTDIQSASVSGGVWDQLPARRFFEELLAEVTECYYSHPLAQESIGYAGMADIPGWTALGLDTLEDREPRPIIRTNE